LTARNLDLRRPADRPWDLAPSQLYNLDCVAYESVMLGEFPLARAAVDAAQDQRGHARLQPRRLPSGRGPTGRAFCGVSEKKEDWNWGNVQSAGGCCLVVGDKLLSMSAA